MADQTFKVNPGDEIIITVPRKQPSANEIPVRRPPAPKAMIRARRNNDILPRRLRKAIKLKFFDLAQLTLDDGATWFGYNAAFVNPSDYIPYYGFGEQLGWYIDQQQETLAQVADYNSALFEVYDDRRFGREVKVSNSSVYPLTVIGFTGTVEEPEIVFSYRSDMPPESWTEDGLKLSDSELNCQILFGDLKGYGAPFGIYERNKITLSNDFAAEAVVNFKLAKDAEIRFVPLLHEGIAEAVQNVAATYERRRTLHSGYLAKPRYFDQPGTLIETNTGNIDVFNRFISGTIQTYRYDAYFNSPVIRGSVEPNTGVEPSIFTSDPNFVVRYRPTAPLSGQLVGVIKQNEQLYYFWQL